MYKTAWWGNDMETGRHSQRTTRLSRLLAELYGCNNDQILKISHFSQDHDIGKTVIPKKILYKPGKLTQAEFNIMKTHVIAGEYLIGKGTGKEIVRKIISDHHERWDGKGYPANKKGEEISLEGRIVMIVDVFDALTSTRPYKKAFAPGIALKIMENDHGHFDPKILRLFLDNKEMFVIITKSKKFES